MITEGACPLCGKIVRVETLDGPTPAETSVCYYCEACKPTLRSYWMSGDARELIESSVERKAELAAKVREKLSTRPKLGGRQRMVKADMLRALLK